MSGPTVNCKESLLWKCCTQNEFYQMTGLKLAKIKSIHDAKWILHFISFHFICCTSYMIVFLLQMHLHISTVWKSWTGIYLLTSGGIVAVPSCSTIFLLYPLDWLQWIQITCVQEGGLQKQWMWAAWCIPPFSPLRVWWRPLVKASAGRSALLRFLCCPCSL